MPRVKIPATIFLLIHLTGLSAIVAQEAGEIPRPRIGLALSGGGARGAAHIAILKLLEREEIPVDFIAGSSFGALVGGFYSLGYTVEEIESILTSQDLEGIFSDTANRRLAPLTQNGLRRYMVRLPMRNLRPVMSPGFLKGQRLIELLNHYTTDRMLSAQNDFDKLPIPFRAVATDFATGEPYVFSKGRMTDALRATVAVPFIFTPWEYGGRMLVDGGLSNNLPTDLVRQMGADIVIAVDVTAPPLTKVESLLEVLDETLSLLMQQSVRRNAPLADYVLRPDLEGFSNSDYSRLPAIIHRAEQWASGQVRPLRAVVGDARVPKTRQQYIGAQDRTIAEVSVQACQNGPAAPTVRFRNAQRGLRSKPNDKADGRILGQDQSRLYATGRFEHVDYQLNPVSDNRYRLTYVVKNSPSQSVGLSFRYDNHFQVVSLAEWRAVELFNSLSSASISAQFGGVRQYSGRLRLVHPGMPNLFLEPGIDYRKLDRIDIRSRERIDQFSDARRGGQLMVGSTFFDHFEIAGGYRFDQVRVRGGTSPNMMIGRDLLAGLRFRLRRDTLNDQEFPTSGMRLNLQADNRSRSHGSDLDYTVWSAQLQKFVPLSGKNTLRLGFAGTYAPENVPFYERAYLGGRSDSELASLPFAGYSRDELAGHRLWMAGATLRREIHSSPLSAIRRAHVFTEYNVAWLHENRLASTPGGTFHGAGFGLALDTLVGPVRIAVGLGESGRMRVYFSFGPGF